MNKKKVLFLHSGAELYGADQILLTIVSNLDKNIFEPIVVLPNDGPLIEKLHENNIRTEIISYPIIRRKIFNIKGIFKFIYSYFRDGKKLCDFIKKEQIDIIHNNTIAVLEGIYLKKKLGIKLITHIHEMIDNPKFVAKFLYRTHLKHCDKVVVVSNAVKKHIENMLDISNENIIVVHNGIKSLNSEEKNIKSKYYKEFNIPKNAKVVSIIGRINSIKGQSDFVDALEKIIKKDSNVYGLIIGDAFSGQEWRIDELKQRIINKNLDNNIICCGFRDDIKSIYKMIDLLVLSSVKYDSFPTVVLEAMSCGIPTVAYKCGGVEEMIINGYNGYLVEQGNVKKLSSNIEKVLYDEVNFKKMCKNSVTFFSENFDIERFVNNFSDIYERCANSSEKD